MKIETEIKIILNNVNIDELINKIENILLLKKNGSFHQTTHQFFEDDFTKQTAFPRIRNEEDGATTLTVKAKIKEEKDSEYFKRIEFETNISNIEDAINMMPFFGYKNKISWEKKRINFIPINCIENDFTISLDETPMGFFLEVESSEEKIEEIIKTLDLANLIRSKKPYLGLWEDYKKENNIQSKDMMFI